MWFGGYALLIRRLGWPTLFQQVCHKFLRHEILWVVQGCSSLGSLVVSLSDGSLSLLRSRDGIMAVTENWHAHDYEPWIAAWNYWDVNVLFSGIVYSSLINSRI